MGIEAKEEFGLADAGLDDDLDLTPLPDGELLIRTVDEVRSALTLVALVQKALDRGHHFCKPFNPGYTPSQSRRVLEIQEGIDAVLETVDALQAQLKNDLLAIDPLT